MASDPMIFVTLHTTQAVVALNAADGSVASSNVIITEKEGTEAGADVDAKKAKLDELRGIYLDAASGRLILVAGGKSLSKVYICPPSKSSTPTAPVYGPPKDMITKKLANSIDHPFAVAFDDDGNCYVSNQDSNVVAGFAVTIKPESAKVNPVASHLTKHYTGTFLDGTVVASAVSGLPGVSANPPVVKGSDGGLDVSIGPDTSDPSAVSYKVQNSVRDVAYVNKLLLVVDEPGGVVRIYDPKNGDYLGASTVANAPGAILDAPTHLLVTSSAIWVSFANQIYASTALPTKDAPSLSFAPLFSVANGTISGMAIDPSGNVYLADRTGKTVMRYSPNFAELVWTANMTDEPEFLLYVPN